jgi:hypothetical protein
MIGFNPVFEGLWNKEPVTCKTTNREFSSLPRPSVAIIDVRSFTFALRPELMFIVFQLYCGYALSMVKQISNGACPVIAWSPSPLSNVLRLAGPESMGGNGDMQAKIADLMAKNEKTFDEVADEVLVPARSSGY